MRLASFNVENMFDRAIALNRTTWADGRPVLEAHRQLNSILNKPRYAAADKAKILQLLEANGMLKFDEGPMMLLRKIRGQLLRRPRKGAVEVVAEGRDSWVGWVDLKTEAVDERATENTARVIAAMNADVLGVVEAEDRTTLCLFNRKLMPAIEAEPYAQVMLIDGNDDRGIDVGLLAKDGYPVRSIRTHVYDADAGGIIFSRDCAEYEIGLPSGQSLWVLVNHFKSKGYGTRANNDAKRRRQAQRVRDIVEARLAEGHAFVAVIGDLNDTPDSAPLQPLLAASSPLRDVADHPNFDDGGRPGTHGNCAAGSKLDYILLSPALFNVVRAGAIERRGMWGGKNGTLWPRFEEVEQALHAASDHAGLWVDLDL
ncbi:MAG: endonuclease/exonuclease/phosphatase family protein [Roseomonas sp.]|nr:endonuclease/exonuclease/phosphatase family protein [Roseomonas sp.]